MPDTHTNTAERSSNSLAATVAFIPDETWSLSLYCCGNFRIHLGFGIHLLVQFLNAAIRHARKEGLYLIYILLLYGPVLLGMVALHAWMNHAVAGAMGSMDTTSASSTTATVLHLTGPTRLPATTTLSQERFVGYMGVLLHIALFIVFGFLYGMFDKFEFDETFSDGVDLEELDSFAGMLANIFAQAAWINMLLVGVNLLYPTVPSNAAALCGSFAVFQNHARAMEIYNAVIGLVLTIVGIFESIVDDNTGIGIFMMCVFPVWFAQSCRRLWVLGKQQQDPSLNPTEVSSSWKAQHPLWNRPCHANTTIVISNTAHANSQVEIANMAHDDGKTHTAKKDGQQSNKQQQQQDNDDDEVEDDVSELETDIL